MFIFLDITEVTVSGLDKNAGKPETVGNPATILVNLPKQTYEFGGGYKTIHKVNLRRARIFLSIQRDFDLSLSGLGKNPSFKQIDPKTVMNSPLGLSVRIYTRKGID